MTNVSEGIQDYYDSEDHFLSMSKKHGSSHKITVEAYNTAQNFFELLNKTEERKVLGLEEAP